MKFSKIILIFVAAILLSATSCQTKTEIGKQYSFNEFATTFVINELDGGYTVSAWGKGNNRADACEQAKRNALRDLIFKGITQGVGTWDKRPLLLEVNAEEKYERYFNMFFAEGGAYNLYVKINEKRTAGLQSRSNSMENFNVICTIDRAALKERLIHDHVLVIE